NTALEFGQPDPTETYSSSAHLFTDLNIPAGTKGRIAKSKRPEGWKPGDDEKPRGNRANSGRSGGQSGSNHKDGAGRGDRDRRRGGDRPHKSEGTKSDGSSTKSETHGGGEHQRPATPRTRNRTRSRGGNTQA
ncbi:MAG: ATP-dependent helicase, partial [Rhodoluna sp.]